MTDNDTDKPGSGEAPSESLPAPASDEKLPTWAGRLKQGTVKSVRKIGEFVWGKGTHYFDALSDKKRINRARDIVAEGAAEQLVKRFDDIDDDYARNVLQGEINRMFSESRNKDQIATIALEDLRHKDADEHADEPVDDDWLYKFFDVAKGVSNAEMQHILGRILSGELASPGSFSARTLSTVTMLDKGTLEVFVSAAGCCFWLPYVVQRRIGARIVEVDDTIGKDGLKKFGITYENSRTLAEAGLLHADLGQYVVAAAEGFTLPIGVGGEVLTLRDAVPDPDKQIQLHGPRLTDVGYQLFLAIEKPINAQYVEAFQEHVYELLDD